MKLPPVAAMSRAERLVLQRELNQQGILIDGKILNTDSAGMVVRSIENRNRGQLGTPRLRMWL